MKKYKVIYADPPWSMKNLKVGGSLKSSGNHHYNVLSLEQLKKLPIPEICDKDCVLFMWWLSSMPDEALELVKAWGFKVKTMSCFNWVKLTKRGKPWFGMGNWTRAGSELCLVATKGKPKRVSASVRSVIAEINAGHSKKPNGVRNAIVDLIGDVPRIELFARDKHSGWDAWGDEIDNDCELEI